MRNLFKIIGKHTLSIYVLHYFVVWRIHIEDMAYILLDSYNYLLYIIVLILVTFIVIFIVISLKRILAQSKFLSIFI